MNRVPWRRLCSRARLSATRGPGLRKTEANRHAFDSLSVVVEPETAEMTGLELESMVCGAGDRGSRRSTWRATS